VSADYYVSNLGGKKVGNVLEPYIKLAETIMLSGISRGKLEESWEFRKGKTFDDVRTQVMKGKKKGMGKFENEAFEIGWNLHKVLIQKKGTS
jgi:hypothetical protein